MPSPLAKLHHPLLCARPQAKVNFKRVRAFGSALKQVVRRATIDHDTGALIHGC